MKKLIVAFAAMAIAGAAQAAAVGWSLAGANNWAKDAYSFFVIGQNGVTDIGTITALLDDGKDFSDYVFGKGTVAANGMASQATADSPYSLDAGKYEAFFVMFDTVSAEAGKSNYAVVSGATGLTKEVGATSASVTFAAANQSSYLGNSDNWHSFGAASGGGSDDVPEPTSGLLMVLGLAGLALKRKRA